MHELEAHRDRYPKQNVDRVLETIIGSYETVWAERDALRTQLDALKEELDKFRQLERALRDGIVTGQRAATQVREEAERERERILAAAGVEREAIVRAARDERQALGTEVDRLRGLQSELENNYRAFLLAALSVFENKPLGTDVQRDGPPQASATTPPSEEPARREEKPPSEAPAG